MGDPGDISQPYKHFVLLCLELVVQYAAVIASIASIGLVDRAADGPSPGVCAWRDCKAFSFLNICQIPGRGSRCGKMLIITKDAGGTLETQSVKSYFIMQSSCKTA